MGKINDVLYDVIYDVIVQGAGLCRVLPISLRGKSNIEIIGLTLHNPALPSLVKVSL